MTADCCHVWPLPAFLCMATGASDSSWECTVGALQVDNQSDVGPPVLLQTRLPRVGGTGAGDTQHETGGDEGRSGDARVVHLCLVRKLDRYLDWYKYIAVSLQVPPSCRGNACFVHCKQAGPIASLCHCKLSPKRGSARLACNGLRHADPRFGESTLTLASVKACARLRLSPFPPFPAISDPPEHTHTHTHTRVHAGGEGHATRVDLVAFSGNGAVGCELIRPAFGPGRPRRRCTILPTFLEASGRRRGGGRGVVAARAGVRRGRGDHPRRERGGE